jgi:dihydrofolate reductase
MRIRAHLAITLDGYATAPAGYPAVGMMPSFEPGVSYGNVEFMQQCDAVVMGRRTFLPAVDNPWWPWPGKQVYVLTSRPLPATSPGDVIASSGGPANLLQQVRSAGHGRDVQILGGPSTVQAFLELDAVDRLELQIMPILGGGGLPLFAPAPTRGPLELDRVQRFDDGTVGLEYRLPRKGTRAYQSP